MAFPRRMPSFCRLLPLRSSLISSKSAVPLQIVLFLSLIALISAQQPNQPCAPNRFFNGNACVCSPGFFDKTSTCEPGCDDEFSSPFTYGACFNAGRNLDKASCNIKCGVRLRLWAIVALFAVIVAAVVVLVLLLPMCLTNCMSCLHAKKASKHSKQVVIEQQQQSPSKDQQLQTLSYNPYSYWPYYGR